MSSRKLARQYTCNNERKVPPALPLAPAEAAGAFVSDCSAGAATYPYPPSAGTITELSGVTVALLPLIGVLILGCISFYLSRGETTGPSEDDYRQQKLPDSSGPEVKSIITIHFMNYHKRLSE